MVNDKTVFKILNKLSNPIKADVAKKDVSIDAESYGVVKGFLEKPNNKLLACTMNNVLFIEDLTNNLLSISRLEACGMEITFKNGKATIKRDNEIIAKVNRQNGLYKIEILIEVNEFAGLTTIRDTCALWHQRMGHLNKCDMHQLISQEMVLGIPKISINKNEFCESCVLGKQTRKSFAKTHESRSSRPLELIHSDLCGPIDPVSWNGGRYFVSFIDDYTHFSVLYVTAKKSEVLQKFKDYNVMSSAKFNTKIKTIEYGETNIEDSDLWHSNLKISTLRSDNGGE